MCERDTVRGHLGDFAERLLTPMIVGESPILAKSLWLETAGQAVEYVPLSGPAKADVCIVGAGFTGLSAALHLAESGRSVVVLDSQQPGWGASGRNGGQVVPGIKATPRFLERVFGRNGATRVIEFVDGSAAFTFDLIDRYGIECDATRSGWIQAAATPKSFGRLAERSRQADAKRAGLELLDASSMEERTGSPAYLGGLLDPRGGMVHPLKYARGLANCVTTKGGTIHGLTPALGIEGDAGDLRVRTSQGIVHCRTVVLATNAYANDIVPIVRRSVVPLISIQIASAPLPDALRASILPRDMSVADVRRLTIYFRCDPEGRLVFGGRGWFNERANRRFVDHLKKQALELFPSLSGEVDWRYHWGGRVGLTTGHLPRLSEVRPGVLAGFGYNGRGVAMATLMGRVVADSICGCPPEALHFPLTKLHPIPFHRLHRLGVAATIGLYRLRDQLDARHGR